MHSSQLAVKQLELMLTESGGLLQELRDELDAVTHAKNMIEMDHQHCADRILRAENSAHESREAVIQLEELLRLAGTDRTSEASSLRRDLDMANSQIKSLQSQLTSAQGNCSELEAHARDGEDVRRSLQVKIEHIQRELDDSNGAISTWKLRLEQSQTHCQELERQLREGDDQRRAHASSADQTAQDLYTTNGKLSSLQITITTLQTNLSHMENRIQESDAAKGDGERRLRESEDSRRVAQNNADRAQSDLVISNNSVTKLQTQLDKDQHTIADLERQMIELERVRQSQLDDHSRTIAELERKIRDLEHDRHSKDSSSEHAQQQLDRANQTIDSLHIRIEESIALHGSLEQRARDSEDARKSAVASLETELETARSQMRSYATKFTDDLNRSKNEHANCESVRLSLEQQINHLNISINSASDSGSAEVCCDSFTELNAGDSVGFRCGGIVFVCRFSHSIFSL